MNRSVKALVLTTLVSAPLALPSPAAASNHLILVREVFAGTTLQPGADYVELMMYSSGQQFTAGTQVRVWNAAGMEQTATILATNVTNGESQRTILIATAAAAAEFSVTPDAMLAASIEGAGGQVCFVPTTPGFTDCVAWGSFGIPPMQALYPGAITADNSIERNIAAGSCATALDASDDTNQGSDWGLRSGPLPRDNDMPPSGTPCTTTTPPPPPPGGDTTAPTSRIDRPKNGKAYAPAKIKKLRGTASDDTGVSEVELALQRKMTNGSCRWWNGSRFVKGKCSTRLFVNAGGTTAWSYALAKALGDSSGTKTKHYRLFSRALDAAGNTESAFEPKRNNVRFEVT